MSTQLALLCLRHLRPSSKPQTITQSMITEDENVYLPNLSLLTAVLMLSLILYVYVVPLSSHPLRLSNLHTHDSQRFNPLIPPPQFPVAAETTAGTPSNTTDSDASLILMLQRRSSYAAPMCSR